MSFKREKVNRGLLFTKMSISVQSCNYMYKKDIIIVIDLIFFHLYFKSTACMKLFCHLTATGDHTIRFRNNRFQLPKLWLCLAGTATAEQRNAHTTKNQLPQISVKLCKKSRTTKKLGDLLSCCQVYMNMQERLFPAGNRQSLVCNQPRKGSAAGNCSVPPTKV